MKIGIIGCGTIANAAHIPSYLKNPEAEIKYFCDILPNKAQACVEKYGCGTAVTDYNVVLADPEIQAVSICTPNYKHAEIAIAARTPLDRTKSPSDISISTASRIARSSTPS